MPRLRSAVHLVCSLHPDDRLTLLIISAVRLISEIATVTYSYR
jgi:hypothetical protein